MRKVSEKVSKNEIEFWTNYIREFYTQEEFLATRDIADPFFIKLLRGRNLYILDAGCGDGRFSIAAMRSGKVRKAVALDVGTYGLDRLDKLSDNRIETCCASVYNIPYEDNEFDAILFIYVIEHLEYPENAMRELFRVLRPGGQILISTDGFYYDYYRRMLKIFHISERMITHTHCSLFTPKKLERLILKSNLRIRKRKLFFPPGINRLTKFLKLPDPLALGMVFDCYKPF